MNFTKSINSSVSRAFFSKNILLIALFILSMSVQGQKIVIAEGDVSICAGSKINLNAKFSIGSFVYFYSANGKAYFLDTIARSWTTAKAAATNYGLMLWMIKQSGEGSAVWNTVPSKFKTTNSFFWIGLYQNPAADATAGPGAGWKWVDETALDPALANWATLINEPDNLFQTNTAANFGSMGFNGTQSGWSDMPDSPPAPYFGYAIAEMPISVAPLFTWQSQIGANPYILTNVPNTTVQPIATTTYTVNIKLGTYDITSTPIVVTVNQPLSNATFTIAPDSISCLVQNKFNFILDQSGIVDPDSTTYLWDFKDGSKSDQGSSLSHRYSAPGQYAVSLTVRDKNGCDTIYTMPSPLIVRDAPLPTIVSAPQKNICQGQTATISIPNPQDGVTYTWTDIDGNILGLGYTIVASTTGKYILEAMLNSSGCKDTVNTEILVNPLPITPSFENAPGAIVCQNDSLLLSIVPTVDTLLLYTWYSGVNKDSIAATSLGKYFAKSPSGMGIVPLTVDFYVVSIDKNKCQSLLSSPYSITFNPSPKVQISSNGMPTSFCEGNEVTIAITAPMQGILDYFWSFDNVPTPLLDPFTSNNFNTNGIVRVRAFDSRYNCGSTSNPINIVVNEYPPKPTIIPDSTAPEITPTGGFNICPGTNSKISTSPLLGASYQWFINDTIIPSAESQSVTINRAGAYSVQTSLNGCPTPSAKISVGLLPPVQGIFIPPLVKTICERYTTTLNASNAFRYQWYLNYKPIESATLSSFDAPSSGVYQVEFFTDKGCKSMSDSLAILSLLKKPTPAFTYDLFCVNVPSIFTNQTISSNSGPVTYYWEFQNGETNDSFNVTHVFPTAGLYKVILNVIPTICPQLVDSISATIVVESPLNGILYPPVEARVGKPISLIARSFGFAFEWVPSTGLDNPNIRIPLLTPTTEQLYTIKILNKAGCLNVDSVLVRIFDEQDIFIAGGFTPNNDGKNDKIYPFLIGINSFHYLKIFNRWGNLVFQTTSVDPELGWDGKYKGRDQPADTYTWIVEAEGENGKVFRKSGSLILIR